MRAICLALIGTLIAIASLIAQRRPASPPTIWPTEGWAIATPESQGLDSGVLADMLEYIRERQLAVHSLVVVRHGRLILDATVYPYDGRQPHDIASATKSITSLLVGIAIDKRFVSSVHDRVVGLLPSRASAKLDPRTERLEVEHLLTMQSGFLCDADDGEKELARMRQSDDWAAFALALPMGADPGTQYAYCSCNTHLLSAIVSARTGDSALASARKYLFGRLGIRDVIWPADPQGRTHGWGDLHLYPRDLAKIGYLYLHGGRWNGEQVVSDDWVKQSIVPRVAVRDGVGYGYGWWVNTARQPAVFEAVGRGGQRLAVLPDKDLVVVFNGGGFNTDELAPFLFRAIRSDVALRENPASARRLQQRLSEARAAPRPHTAGPLPMLARRISGRSFVIEANPLKLERLALIFSDRSQARATLRMLEDDWSVPVGLDGAYRFSSTGPHTLPMAATGEWVSADEFVLDLNTVAKINRFTIRMQFAGEEVRLRIDEATGEIRNLFVAGRVDSR